MMVLKSVATAFVLFVLAQPVFAQSTGPNVLGSLRDQLRNQTTLRAELSGSDQMNLFDARSGAEVVTVRQINPQTILLSGVVGNYNHLSSDLRARALRQISYFNYSSAVGTLSLNEATGEITMAHYVNPRLVSVPAMASVATMFTQVAAAQQSYLQ